MDILRAGSERSVAELAQIIGISGAAAHYHVNRLVGVGLAVEAGQRRTGPRSERLYRAVSSKIRILPRTDSPEYMEALLDLALGAVRKLEREIEAAYHSPPTKGTNSPVRITSRRGRVKMKDLPRLNALLDEAANLLEADTATGGEIFTLRIFLVKTPSP